MNVVQYDKLQWELVAEGIHEIVFGEYRPNSLNRYDYVLCVWNGSNPVGYITCRETDSESVYIGYGGVVPESRQTEESKEGMTMLLDFLKKKYMRANMMVENTNVKMLKKAMNHGFVAVGIFNYRGSIYLDLRNEWGENE